MESDYILDTATYERSIRLFSRVKGLLGTNIRLHQSGCNIADGDIFLFNHFSRFETFIPQYLIYQETGSFCRSIASSEFFKQDEKFSNFLIKMGAVPHKHPDLIPFLARDILRGHKVVLFPEGGMVKDKSVLDEHGHFSIYSRSAKLRRKQHTGAAVLSMTLEGFKSRIRLAEAENDQETLEHWKNNIGVASIEHLLVAAHKPTMIIPANITFYPIHIEDNFLRRTIEIFNRKKLSDRAAEEIMIEGNLLLKNTDMDIRLGEAVIPAENWKWWDRLKLHLLNRRTINITDYVNSAPLRNRLTRKLIASLEHHRSSQIRDVYMQRMYSQVTVNLSHLASVAVYKLIDHNIRSIEADFLYRIIFLSIIYTQKRSDIFLHARLKNPEYYGQLLTGGSEGMRAFLKAALTSGLLKRDETRLLLTDKLLGEHDFDQVRIENVLSVYANEVAPISAVQEAVEEAVTHAASLTEKQWAEIHYEDELKRYEWNRTHYSAEKYATINTQQTATETGEPFFFQPEPAHHKPLGVVLTHGLLASPAEIKEFGQRLVDQGYPVIGTRLDGHGTSPWDLKNRDWHEWVDSIKRSYHILSPHCEQICLIGFSTGSAANLIFAADQPEKLAGIVAVSTPVKFSNKNIVFVPLLYGLSKLLGMVSSSENSEPFKLNESEHPDINYRHIPIRTLYVLRQMIDVMLKRLTEITAPILIMQASDESIIDPSSAETIEKQVASENKTRIMIPSDKHGILSKNTHDCQAHVIDFLTRLSSSIAVQQEAQKSKKSVYN